MEDRFWDVALMVGSAVTGVILSELVGFVKRKVSSCKHDRQDKRKP